MLHRDLREKAERIRQKFKLKPNDPDVLLALEEFLKEITFQMNTLANTSDQLRHAARGLDEDGAWLHLIWNLFNDLKGESNEPEER